MLKNKMKLVFTLMIVLILPLAAACSMQPATPPEPTVDAMQVAGTMAMQIVSTSFAAITQTALANPTATYTPTATPTPPATQTPTPTRVVATNTPAYVYIPPTATVQAQPSVTPTQGNFQCVITRLDPGFGTEIKKDGDFDIHVTMKNTGLKTWTAADFDFKHLSGVSFQDSVSSVDLQNDVVPGDSVTIIVDATAKADLGVQNANWGLVAGGENICPVLISIKIVE